MKFYHGTGERHVEHILRVGIKPRGYRKGNWQHTLNSNSRAVYLTTAYGLHFANNCVKGDSERLAIFEIDSEALDPDRLAPDEDFLEQATRNDPSSAVAGSDMKSRTLWFRKRAFTKFRHLWRQSVEHMGTLSYYGTIPPTALTRLSLIPSVHELAEMSDPSVGISNYKLMGPFYRNLTQLAFLEVEDLDEDSYWMIRTDGEVPKLDGIEVRNLNKV